MAHLVMTVHRRGRGLEGGGPTGVRQTCPAGSLHLRPLSWAPFPQMTYSLTRFAIYESVRDHVTTGSQGPLPFYKKVLLGSISGELPTGLGGGVGARGHRQSPHAGSGVCHPRLHRRLRGDPCRYGQRQVSVHTHPGRGLSCPLTGPRCVLLGKSRSRLGVLGAGGQAGAGPAAHRQGEPWSPLTSVRGV